MKKIVDRKVLEVLQAMAVKENNETMYEEILTILVEGNGTLTNADGSVSELTVK